jgi:hypothetical protein
MKSIDAEEECSFLKKRTKRLLFSMRLLIRRGLNLSAGAWGKGLLAVWSGQ